ncbi:hypothetical protein GP486_007627 [Trichoglossum hirsutum]|uniref:Uncharacterized protein n=1 Tax=Trichoglossum hirsutum TaxID=265104 RepID=A0A9P8L6R8_9PEZI|nr:hypothetical protein GP486_007627 [Trichoglossum hirsutum]
MVPHSSQHDQQSEEPKTIRRPCSCEHTRDNIATGISEAAGSMAHYGTGGIGVTSTSVQHPVNTSSNNGIGPLALATTNVVACGPSAITTIFVTETVVAAMASGLLSPASSLQAISQIAHTGQFTSSSSSKPSSPALPPSGFEGVAVAGLQTDTSSTVTIFETLTVIPLPVPSEASYQGPQQGPNNISPKLSSSGDAEATSTLAASTSDPQAIGGAYSSSVPIVPPPPIKFASGSSVIIPVLAGTYLHGASSNRPSTQYIKPNFRAALRLHLNLTVNVNGTLPTNYGISPDTGVNAMDKSRLANLTGPPHLSRDGGKGGYLNGQHLFVFRDTRSYSSTGEFLGLVSSSVATDSHMNGLSGKPLELEDGIGEWSDNAGRLRGFVPLTTSEQAYNTLMQGKGRRYAVWPESSIIPFNKTHALMYAPIIHDSGNTKTQNGTFTYTGNTLLAVTAGGEGGPRAERIVEKLFGQKDVEWGVIGGLRSYGPSGIGGNDGKVYVFGRAKGGLLVGRVDAGQVAHRSSVNKPSPPFPFYRFPPSVPTRQTI